MASPSRRPPSARGGAFSTRLAAAQPPPGPVAAGPLPCRGRRAAAAGNSCLASPTVRRGWAAARRSRLVDQLPVPAQPRAPASAGGSRARWCVRSADWEPEGRDGGAEFRFLVSLLNEPLEREIVGKYKYWEDRRRALISRLLARKASASALGLDSFRDIEIMRTKGGRPFLWEPDAPREHPNFNFSISHEGDYVVLASEPVCICGADVGAPREKRDNEDGQHGFRGSFEQFEAQHANDLTETELSDAHAADNGSMPACFDHFLRVWACKESVLKAVGTGIRMHGNHPEMLGQQPGATPAIAVEVTGFGPPLETCAPAMRILGQAPRGADAWNLVQGPLPDGHRFAVARGPPGSVIDDYGDFSVTLRRREFTAAEWREELEAPAPSFEMVPVAALVPADRWEEYLRVSRRRGPEDFH